MRSLVIVCFLVACISCFEVVLTPANPTDGTALPISFPLENSCEAEEDQTLFFKWDIIPGDIISIIPGDIIRFDTSVEFKTRPSFFVGLTFCSASSCNPMVDMGNGSPVVGTIGDPTLGEFDFELQLQNFVESIPSGNSDESTMMFLSLIPDGEVAEGEFGVSSEIGTAHYTGCTAVGEFGTFDEAFGGDETEGAPFFFLVRPAISFPASVDKWVIYGIGCIIWDPTILGSTETTMEISVRHEDGIDVIERGVDTSTGTYKWQIFGMSPGRIQIIFTFPDEIVETSGEFLLVAPMEDIINPDCF